MYLTDLLNGIFEKCGLNVHQSPDLSLGFTTWGHIIFFSYQRKNKYISQCFSTEILSLTSLPVPAPRQRRLTTPTNTPESGVGQQDCSWRAAEVADKEMSVAEGEMERRLFSKKSPRLCTGSVFILEEGFQLNSYNSKNPRNTPEKQTN